MAEWKEIARDLSGFVATFLSEKTGDTWSVDQGKEHDWSVWLVRTDAEGKESGRVFVRPDDKDKERIMFSATYPANTVYPRPRRVQITCDRFKDVDKIAGDILRRLLPDAEAEWTRVAEGNALDVEQLKAREAAYESLSAVVPLDRGREEPKVSDTQWVADWRGPKGPADHHVTAEVKANVWGSVFDVKLANLTIDQVHQILWVLKGGRNTGV